MRKQFLWSAFSLLIALSWATPVLAQKAKLRKAEAKLTALRYQEAIDIYEKVYRKRPELLAPVLGLAKAYRKLGLLDQAEEWYARALLFSDLPPEVHFQYGQLLFQRGDCAAAQLAFQAFLERKPYDERRFQLENVCAYRQQLLTRGQQRTSLDHPDFNGPQSDLGPALYDGGLVFGSVRPGPKDKVAFYDLYYTEPLPDTSGTLAAFSPISSFSTTINSGGHEAIVTFSPNGEEVFFTRNQAGTVSEKQPLQLLEIMFAHKDSTGRWANPQPLPFNNETYSTAHPALSSDGQRLFFSSDRPGGFGGKDIYVSERFGRSWSSPVNLGPKVNTEGDELFPFYHRSGELYFASDGHLGLGGQDVFRVEDLGDGDWGRVENLGLPVNSAADDFGLVLNPDASQGYFTSNRSGGSGDDDIYAFRPRSILLELQLATAEGEPLDTIITFQQEGTAKTFATDKNAYYRTYLAYNECIYLTVNTAGFLPARREICAVESGLADTLRLSWPLRAREAFAATEQLPPDARPVRLIVKDALTELPLPETQVSWELDGSEAGVQEFLTDEQGELNTYLALNECVSLAFVKPGYFSQLLATPLCAEDLSAEPLEIVLTPYRLQANQTYENRQLASPRESGFVAGSQVYADASGAIPYLLNIYYDLGRASVRSEAVPELHKLHRLLLDNPDLVIEIGSHTDAQGAAAFNARLSQRRADAIARWLYAKGIPQERVVARGYGETRLTNHCADGVDCSDAEHQANRRTEFRVLEHTLGQSN